ncbi:MAG: glucose 1-dehydrogenase [Polyangiaceae bacterium]|nr:glucose 1-dehydrogenase [Polyangiaceae bacterium]
MGEFEGKIALITGGNAGLGRAAAEAFAREGAKVVFTARREELGREVEGSIRATGGDATFIRADVTSEDDVKALVERTLSIHGRLDYAYNNAWGALRASSLVEMTAESFDRDLAFLRAIFFCMKYEIPAIAASGGGAIVNCSSLASQSVQPGLGAYSAAKAGLEALTRTAAVESAAKNIRVNAIVAGAFETAMAAEYAQQLPQEALGALFARLPMKRMGRPAELADAVLFLCSDRAAFITGANLQLDGGFRIT